MRGRVCSRDAAYPAVPAVILGVFTTFKERAACRSSTRSTSTRTSAADTTRVSTPAVRERSPAAERPAVDPGPPRGRRSRCCWSSLILIVLGVHSCQVSSAQQRPEGLHQQRLLADPAVQQHRHSSCFQHPLQRRRREQRHQRLRTRSTRRRAERADPAQQRRELSVPERGQDGPARTSLLALQMRLDGITNIAQQIQPALGNSASKDAINSIAAEMARFYASDVALQGLHDARRSPAALHGAGIAVGGANGDDRRRPVPARVSAGCTPTFIASQLHVSLPQSAPERQVRPRPPRPLAELGQRRRHHRSRPARPTPIPASRRRPSRSTSPTAAPTTRPTWSARSS